MEKQTKMNISKVIIFVLLTITALHADVQNKNLAVVYTYDEKNDKAFNSFIEKDLLEIGYFLNSPHKRVNDVYERKFGSTHLETIGFSPILNEEVVRPLLNKEPRLGAFSPMNLLHYRTKADNKTVIAHLTPEAMLDILDIKDESIRKEYIESFKPLDAMIEERLGGTKSYIPSKGYPEQTTLNFELSFDEPEELDDLIDEIKDNFEYAFLTKGFVIAGFYEIKDSFNSEEDVMSDHYSAYWSYSLCHIPFSYAIFDGENPHPQVGMFAPCSVYMYIKEGENKLVIGMVSLNTWIKSLGIEDQKRIDEMVKLDQQIVEIFESLGAVNTSKKVVTDKTAEVKKATQEAPKETVAKEETKTEATPEIKTTTVEKVVQEVPKPAPTAEETVQKSETPVETIEKSAPVVAEKPAVVKEKVTPEPKKIAQETPKQAAPVEKTVAKAQTTAPVKEVVKSKDQSNVSEIVITLPKVPKPPQVKLIVPKLISLDADGKMVEKESMDEMYKKQEHIFSNRVAPDRFQSDLTTDKQEILPGDIENSRVAAYLHSDLISVDQAVANLQKAGFTILSKFNVDKKGEVISIVYTNEDMILGASKNIRGFAGSLRVLIDTKNQLTVIANPIYMMKAFMQNEYDEKLALSTLNSLRAVFTNLKNSPEQIKFNSLERYRFMENMPYYQDMTNVAEGKNQELLERVKNSKQVVFEQHLKNGSVIVGVQLGKRTSKFVKKTGYQNSGLLPYPVLIEGGKAKILAPEYYISVMYPMLKMSQFMQIATIPGAIRKEITKAFR